MGLEAGKTAFPADSRGSKGTEIFADLFRANQRVFQISANQREIVFDCSLFTLPAYSFGR